jgi:carboxyl-terminal processing protease
MITRLAKYAFLILFTAIIFSGGYLLGQSSFAPIVLFGPSSSTPAEAEAAFQPFWETWRLLQNEYFDQPLDNGQLAKGAIDGMLATLGDPNTRYLPPDQETAARNQIQGQLEGIGAEVTEDEDGAIVIVSPYEGSPAEDAGLLPGDILLEADGTPLTGMPVAEAASLVRGPAGTIVTLTINRDGEVFEVEVTRGIIRVPSVRGEILEDNNIAYIRLSRFGDNTAEEINDLLVTLMAQNPSGIIIDVRGNPGGSLETVVHIADQFLTEGPILIQRFGNGTDKNFTANNEGLAQDIPLVILIDGGSASASEVLAGAIQDRERGVLIGTTSYGKGTVQTWWGLSNKGGIRITTARWLTPDEHWVHGQGLEPDYYVALPEAGNIEDFTDTQLEAAVDYLTGQPVIETELEVVE